MVSKSTVAIFSFVLAGIFFFFHPIPSCSYYVNFFIFQYCGAPIQVFGFDPNLLAGMLFVIAGIAVFVFGRDRYG